MLDLQWWYTYKSSAFKIIKHYFLELYHSFSWLVVVKHQRFNRMDVGFQTPPIIYFEVIPSLRRKKSRFLHISYWDFIGTIRQEMQGNYKGRYVSTTNNTITTNDIRLHKWSKFWPLMIYLFSFTNYITVQQWYILKISCILLKVEVNTLNEKKSKRANKHIHYIYHNH